MRELFWWFVVVGILITGTTVGISHALADQKGIQYHIELKDGITFTDNIQTEQTIEGVKYKVSLSDSIGTRDHLQ